MVIEYGFSMYIRPQTVCSNGRWCAGCGGTRSTQALFHDGGHFSSLGRRLQIVRSLVSGISMANLWATFVLGY